jgi:Dolichyl-phosphate-mannose-protein mannosyltransferase
MHSIKSNIYIFIGSWINENKILFSIIIIGFFLRFSTVFWGFPISPYVKQYHPDAPKVYSMTAAFPKVYFTDKRFLTYGTSISYTLGTALLPAKIIMVKLLGLDKYYKNLAWIISRFFSVACGVGTIYIGYLITLKLFNKKTAILSAAFIATSFYHTMNSSIATLDVPMSFILMLNFLLCFKAIEKPGKLNYVLLGLASGLLMGTKIPGGLFFIIPFLLAFLGKFSSISVDEQRQIKLNSQFKFLLIYVITGVVFFAIFHPHIFLDPQKYINAYMQSKYNWVDRVHASFPHMIQLWLIRTSTAVNFLILIFGLLGILTIRKKYWQHKVMLLVFVALYYSLWRSFLPSRFVITIAPIICIFASSACIFMTEHKNRIIGSLGIGACTISIIYSLYICISGINIRLHDTRTLASRYIAEKFIEGITIGLSSVTDKYKEIHPWRNPKIDFSKFQFTNFLDEPEILVTSSYVLDKIERALKSDKLLPGYKWDPLWNKDWYRYSPPSPRIFKFYDTLLNSDKSNYILLEKFQTNINVPIEFPPPEIKIYRKKSH